MAPSRVTIKKNSTKKNWKSDGKPIKILTQDFECVCGSRTFAFSREVSVPYGDIRRMELTCQECSRIYNLNEGDRGDRR